MKCHEASEADADWQRIELERQLFMTVCRAFFPDCNFQFEVGGGVGILVETHSSVRLEYYPFYSDGRKFRLEMEGRYFPNDHAYKTLGRLVRCLKRHNLDSNTLREHST